jgi:UDP-N-acetylmuramoyl-tripeptide--D-alanyl-D-alanine ligase
MNLNFNDFKKLSYVRFHNKELLSKLKFSGVSIDSRKISKKQLFFAIKGNNFDGHNFIFDVFKKQVNCAVVSKKWYSQNINKISRSFKNNALIIVNNTEKALQQLAAIYRDKFLLPVIAVAGSNGKTTAKDYIADVLSQKYSVLKTEGNYNNHIGVPLTLFNLTNKHQIAVLELGTNHFGEIDKLCKIAKPQFGIITNIGKEHLEFLKNLRGVAKAEGELVEYLKTVYGVFFLNADDNYLHKYRKQKNIKIVAYSFKNKGIINAKFIKFNKFFPQLEINFKNKKIKTQLKNIGFQSCNAALAAAAVGWYFDVPLNKIRYSLNNYVLDSKKRNCLINANNIWIIDDTYNSNPDSVIEALNNFNAYQINGKKFLVLADMLELGKSSKQEHFKIGKYIKKMKFDSLLTFGAQSYYTFLGAKGLKNNFYFNDKESLINFLNKIIKAGDAVLVKGSRSMAMESVVNKIILNQSNYMN